MISHQTNDLAPALSPEPTIDQDNIQSPHQTNDLAIERGKKIK